MTSLQHAGGIYGLVALSPSVGVYAGGRFTSNVPIRVVQPATHPNNSLDFKTENNSHPGIKEEGQNRRRRRQASIPAVPHVILNSPCFMPVHLSLLSW